MTVLIKGGTVVNADGSFELYHGGLRARDSVGKEIFDHIDYTNYTEYLRESVKDWSYMKFPFITSLGEEAGWYRVGPLARVNNCNRFDTPLAEQERQDFAAAGEGRPLQAALATHWARVVEMVYAAERTLELARDDEILSDEIRTVPTAVPSEGVGCLEAPRGTLTHHYVTDERGILKRVNLVVGTTNNHAAICMSIKKAAKGLIRKGVEITEGLLNQVEMAFRAYDPCFACATHSLPGRMPLAAEPAVHQVFLPSLFQRQIATQR